MATSIENTVNEIVNNSYFNIEYGERDSKKMVTSIENTVNEMGKIITT